MGYMDDNVIEITEYEYCGIHLKRMENGWKILELEKEFKTAQEAETYIRKHNK